MTRSHLIRVGVMGRIGRFRAVRAHRFARRTRVIVRTDRGLEVGEVVGSPEMMAETDGDAGRRTDANGHDGELLRKMTVEDELLAARLEENRHEAFEACERLLQEQDISAMLIDAEQLFDGRGIFFYFLGDVPATIESCVARLAEKYDSVAKLSRFAETLENGCGPLCGTEQGGGGGCDDCSSCSVSAACLARPS